MATNVQSITKLAQDATAEIGANPWAWTNFLVTASRLYRYSFPDQLLIHAQRPDATACASFDLWKDTMRRYIRKGSKGIALLDDSGDKEKIKYVFDVSDTGTSAHLQSRSPNLWELQARHLPAVSYMLQVVFEASEMSLYEQIMDISERLAAEYYHDHQPEILEQLENSLYEDDDPLTVEIEYRETLAMSLAYTLCNRCGLDVEEMFDASDFPHLIYFDTPESITSLGTANCELSEQVLMEIGSVVKRLERNLLAEQERKDTHEQGDIQSERGLPDTQPDIAAAGTGAAEQVRPNAQKPPETAQAVTIQFPSVIGQLAELSAGNRRNSQEANRADDDRAIGERPAAQQEQRPDEVAGAHEQPTPASGGTSAERPYIEQLSLFPSEQDTIQEIAEANASAISLSSEEIDSLLSLESNAPDGHKFFVYDFMKEHGRERKAVEVLKTHLPVRVYTAPDGKSGIAYDENGAVAYKGTFANREAEVKLPWPKVQARIVKLIANNQYITEREQTVYAVWKQEQLPAMPEPGRMAQVGDAVYMDNKPYLISEIGVNVQLMDAETIAPLAPKHISIPRSNFYNRLTLDDRNKPYTDYYADHVDDIDENVRQVLSQLMTPEKQAAVTQLLDAHTTNYELAHELSKMFPPHTDQITLDGWQPAEYTVVPNGMEVEIEETDGFSLSWIDLSPYVRGMASGWEPEPPLQETPEQDEVSPSSELPQPEAPAIELEEPAFNFEKVADTVLGRVMQDEDYTEALAQAKTRASLRNPCAWAIEQSIRDHEQDEPELCHQYFFDRKFNDQLHSYVLNKSYEQRPQVEQTKETPQTAERVEIPIGTKLEIDGRQFEVERVNYDWNNVSLKDVTFQSATGFPISRSETIEFVLQYWQPLTEPEQAAVEPATEVDAPPAAPATLPTDTGQEPVNYRITGDPPDLGGAKTKYKNNVEAIRTLKTIEAENRLATPEEQEVLHRYVGWGGIPQAFSNGNESWQKEYAELKDLLTPDEYRAARSSTLNAHYTSETVIKAIYNTVERTGLKQANILEPGCGTGKFFGLLPDSMQASNLYGVELDSITGRIAQQLYQKANISVCGFEKTDLPNAFFDLAIGNVPFGGYKVADKEYDRLNFNIHDYFFAKSFDKVRPGGVVAFITSSGTMDKQNPEVRKYLAQRGELMGAVRLPNNAFLKNAGTEVTADVLFFRKRDRLIDIEPDWVHLGQTEDGIPVNSYFAENPEMVLGTIEYDPSMYGDEKDTTCVPFEGADLTEQLQEAMRHIQTDAPDVSLDDLPELEQELQSIPADPTVKNYSYTLVDNEVYYRENSQMFKRELPKATAERVRGMVALRDCVQSLIQYQLENYPDTVIQREQQKLNHLYDNFTRKYGLINSRGNNTAFSDDSAYYLLCSLEILDETGELERKTDMFHKRTIKKPEPVTHVDTASEALAVSIGEKACVDLGYMHSLSGLSHEQLIHDLQGVIYRVPANNADTTEVFDAEWQTADEYLSGDVREKLWEASGYAEQYPDLFTGNVEALTAIQPPDLEANEISVRLGVDWIDASYVKQFMDELLETSGYEREASQVLYFDFSGEWSVQGKYTDYGNVLANVTYGTGRASAYRLLEDALNQRDTRIYDLVMEDGKERRVLNKKETMLAQQKQESIKEAFKNWIFQNPERRQHLVEEYNVRFNSIRPREYDGSHIRFTGMNPDIEMRPHQFDAVAHGLYGDNVLLAHEVGAGKTFEMIALAMESKRLGLTQKSMITVPNHLTEQFASDFLRLYPSANILVARKKDFETKNRKKFCARIATGDYDAVIIGHSQFGKIPISRARQERLINQQIDEIAEGIAQLKRDKGERIWIKRLEGTKKSLEARLERLTSDSRKDDVVTFEELGVDKLFVDEAHEFKNLFMYTKMRNVAGVSTSDAQKSSDLFLKTQYLDELTGGRGTVFATGTPISNSMTELYTMMRYLQYSRLMEKGYKHFDSWAAQYGETVTAIELAPEGTGYRARTRFSKFYNLPELMNFFKEAADIKTADMLDLPVPNAHYHTEVVKPSDIQLDMVADLSERASKIHDGRVDPRDDNMLKITSDGRKIGLDQRLIDPSLPDHPGSKVNACIGNVFRIWDETKAQRSTQLVFCDMSTPKNDGSFNVYDDIKAKLITKGVPEQEIAFIHDAKTEAQKKEMFAKVRRGQVRVLLGSTSKMGSGTNVQDKLVATHDLDCPWRPSDLTQRSGRIVRQGNDNKDVHIYRYVTEKTFDAYLWQTVENKQKFIAQIMTSKTPARVCEDMDATALSFAEIKALCAGDPLVKEKTDLELEIRKLRVLKSEFQSQHYKLQDNLTKHYPAEIKATETRITALKSDQERLQANTQPNDKGFSPMVVGKKTYTAKEDAGKALLYLCKSIKPKKGEYHTDPVAVGRYRGMDMELTVSVRLNQEYCYKLNLKGAMSYEVELGGDVFGNITRIDNELADIPARIGSNEEKLVNIHKQVENAKLELQRPFAQEVELEQKVARLAEVDTILDLDKHEPELMEDEPEGGDPAEPEQAGRDEADEKPEVAAKDVRQDIVAKGAPPSILAHLKNAAKMGGAPASNRDSKETDITI